MNLEDQYKLYVEAYYGILETEEYDLNIYEAKNIEKIIENFKKEYPIDNYDYEKQKLKIKDEVSTKTKLQSALIILNQIKGPMELILIIKNKLKKYK